MMSWVGALRLQAIVTGIVCASAVALGAPASPGNGGEGNERDLSPKREISRGSDITHGIAFVLAPDWGVVHRNALRRIRDEIGAALRADGIRHDHLRISGGAIRVSVESSALARAEASIARTAEAAALTAGASMPGLAVHAAPGGDVSINLTGFGLAALQDAFIASARRQMARRLFGNGFGDYLLTGDGARFRVEIPPMTGLARAGRQC